MTEKETRAFICEVRAEENEQYGTHIVGHPIVTEQKTDMGWYEETIASEALNDTDMKDVKFLYGHRTDMIPLARSRNNNENSTMQLIKQEDGLHVRVNLDTENNAEARALYSAIKRGDISGMSFMFLTDRDKDVWTDMDSDYPKRRITSILKVFEVSAVAFPAYEQTSIQVASEDSALDSARASLESAKKRLEEERAAKAEQDRRTAVLDRLINLMKEVNKNEV